MKNNSKKNDPDFSQNSMTRDMNWKLGKTGVASDVSSLKVKMCSNIRFYIKGNTSQPL